jgi:hypothetical protein
VSGADCAAKKGSPHQFFLASDHDRSRRPESNGCVDCAIASGEVTPSEATELSKLIEAYLKSLEVTDLADRITKLEKITADATAAK